jgi:hypothetical protein
MKKTLTIILVLACLTAAAQTRLPTFFETTMVRTCLLDVNGEVVECDDMASSLTFEVGPNVEYVRMIRYNGEMEHYHIFDSEMSDDEKRYYFYTRRQTYNNRYDFIFDFSDQTIFVKDKDDEEHGYLFYYSKMWRE